jgi:hypothetical protein
LEIFSSTAANKFFEIKILPLSDCISRINLLIPAKLMIPEDQGMGAHATVACVPFRETRAKTFFEDPSLPNFPARHELPDRFNALVFDLIPRG